MMMEPVAVNECLNCVCPVYIDELLEATKEDTSCVGEHRLYYEISKITMFVHVLTIKCSCGAVVKEKLHTSKKIKPSKQSALLMPSLKLCICCLRGQEQKHKVRAERADAFICSHHWWPSNPSDLRWFFGLWGVVAKQLDGVQLVHENSHP